jgi:hypothetical protein
VQHPGVGGLASEGDGGAGDLRIRAGAGAAVGEQDRSAAESPHAGQHLPDRGDRAVDGELDGGGQVVDGGFQNRAQELRLRDRAVLENFDRPEVLGGPVQGGGQRLRVADISGVPAGAEAVAGQIDGEVVDVLLIAGRRATASPSAPNLRATAAPRPRPAPMMAMVVTVLLQMRVIAPTVVVLRHIAVRGHTSVSGW